MHRTAASLRLRARAAGAWALVAVSARYATLVAPIVSREVRRWRARAATIPNPLLRAAALDTLADERWSAEGAALFATLAPARCRRLVRLLATYQILWDYLDTITEWRVPDQVKAGRQLHRALVEALDPGAPVSDYYAEFPWRDDSYLMALVEACRALCATLPRFQDVHALVVGSAARAEVQAFNHDLRADRRLEALQRWAARETPGQAEARWWELTAGATASPHIHALLALAADRRTTAAEIARSAAAYSPWVPAAATMLDSLVDRDDDAVSGDHSYIGYYADADESTSRLQYIVERAREVRHLPRGDRHEVIVGGMIALYLSAPTACSSTTRDAAKAVLAVSGPHTKVLLPVMRALRRVRARRERLRLLGRARAAAECTHLNSRPRRSDQRAQRASSAPPRRGPPAASR